MDEERVDRQSQGIMEEDAAAASGDGGGDRGRPGEQPSQEPDAADAELDALQREYRALNDRLLRLAAEFDNYRKRTERERTELWGRAQGELVKRLLDILDDMQRYTSAGESTSAESLLEGARLVEKKFRHALESAGLESIAAEGEFFNPATMEALMTVPTGDADEDELVASVFQKGYRFKDVLLRPARVQVKKFEH